jgi:hypothetical protein
MRDFLSALWTPPHGYGELRFIQRGNVIQEFINLTDEDAYDRAARLAAIRNGQGYDCYMGVLRRQRPGGKAADAADMSPVLWADIDPYKASAGDGPSDSLMWVLTFAVPPSIIVDSGHGIHVYWLLRQAVPVATATLAMKGIAKDIGGDNTHDAARVLRLPGTNNYKGGGKVPVRLLRLDMTRRYYIGDFAEWIDRASVGGTPARWRTTTPVVTPESVPGYIAELLNSDPPRGERSEPCFKAVSWLVRHGFSDEQVEALLMAAPLGERYRERPRKLDVDIRKARQS